MTLEVDSWTDTNLWCEHCGDVEDIWKYVWFDGGTFWCKDCAELDIDNLTEYPSSDED